MKIDQVLKIYQRDTNLSSLATWLKDEQGQKYALRGLVPGMDSLVGASLSQVHQGLHLFVLEDREEAAYFHNDLQSMFPDREILFFPTSYKKPYEVVLTENANILQRAEVLNQLQNKKRKSELVVTYPDALSEKVINKQALNKNTLIARKGEELGRDYMSELLTEYGFEHADFVFEAGQFSIRGDIVDIFSFSHELPYRVEFFGDEIESIRAFNPDTQLSEEELDFISIIPNVQTRLLKETRESFLEFIPRETIVWIKNVPLTMEVVEGYYQKVEENFKTIREKSGHPDMLSEPRQLWDTKEEFQRMLLRFSLLEFGTQFHLDHKHTLQFNASPQLSFNKDFNLLASKLKEYQSAHYEAIICSDSAYQLDRLENILEEHGAVEQFKPLHLSLRQGFVDIHNKVALLTDHQIFERFHKYKTKTKYSKSKALTLKEIKTLQPGDYVTHIDYGIGKFAGLSMVENKDKKQEAVRIIYKDNDVLTVSLHNLHKISKYSGKETAPPKLSKLGSQEWENKKKRVKKKVKDIAEDLINLYAKRRESKGHAFDRDTYLQTEMESSFIYEDTPDQEKATQAIKEDMEKTYPMDRLVCGDVGFGKTEVALRAAFKAATEGKQVAIMVPTTILAMQHYKTFRERLEPFGLRIDYLNRFRSTKEKNAIYKDLEEGKIDILVGTHNLVGKKVTFKNLGLMVIDEEQKFGVKVKEKLKEIKVNVDCLTLTATPIPRTLQFSLMGARDLSIIETPPPNRQPVTTEIHAFTEDFIRDAISYEIGRGGQVFFVHNRVKDIEQIANIVLRLVPDSKVGIAHGQMDAKQLEKTMLKFIDGEYDILVSTNIVESGLDIPNSNTIIINHAHYFGMSDLHQMRGRVGRSNRKAFCYLLVPSLATITPDAKKRLKALEEFSNLGDGFKVAMRDLDIRGAGNLLGGEQSGFVSDIGFDMYHKVLDDAVKELKHTTFKDLFSQDIEEAAESLVQDTQIETDLEIRIPEDYVANISERLELYTQLDNIEKEEELQRFRENIRDRFGPIPQPVEKLIDSVRLRRKAGELGFHKLLLKEHQMKAYVDTKDNEAYFKGPVFGQVLDYVQSMPQRARIRDMKNKMLFAVKNVPDVEAAMDVLNQIEETETVDG